jgi:hypothetical protein
LSGQGAGSDDQAWHDAATNGAMLRVWHKAVERGISSGLPRLMCGRSPEIPSRNKKAGGKATRPKERCRIQRGGRIPQRDFPRSKI